MTCVSGVRRNARMPECGEFVQSVREFCRYEPPLYQLCACGRDENCEYRLAKCNECSAGSSVMTDCFWPFESCIHAHDTCYTGNGRLLSVVQRHQAAVFNAAACVRLSQNGSTNRFWAPF